MAEWKKRPILQPRDGTADIIEEARRWRGMTPNERAPFVKAVCAGAAKAVASHSDWEAVRDYEEPMPESSARLWKRMRERYRRARKS